jgi:VCBS repeat-containing protein
VEANASIGGDTAVQNRSSRIENELLSKLETNSDNKYSTTDTAQSTSTEAVYDVVVIARSGQVSGAEQAIVGAGGTVHASANGQISAELTATGVRSVANAPTVSFVRTPRRPIPTAMPENQGLDNMGVLSAQQRGYTGENTTVAVIDFAGGFNAKNSEIRDNVIATKEIGDNTFKNRTGGHGTATAEVVADTAPNTSLVLISIENYVELQNAINYVDRRGDVDATVMSFSFFGADPLDGSGAAAQEISDSVANGTLYFTSAGNYANRQHLNQTYTDTDNDGFHEFNTSNGQVDEGLDLGLASFVDNEPVVEIFVQWNDWKAVNEDYDLRLINETTNEVVQESTNSQTGIRGQRPVERVSIDTSTQNLTQLDLAITNEGANGTAKFNLFTYNGGIFTTESTATQSIAVPGTAADAVTVGAVNSADNSLEPFSSQGPTIDGRRKPDVVAVDNIRTSVAGFDPYFGTSASAPSAAGVAALVIDANTSAAAPEIENALFRTSRFVTSRTKPNNQTGVGLLNASAATVAVTSSNDATPPESANQVPIAVSDLPGDGTAARPYQISNASELQAIEDDLTANYTLVSDIDATNTSQWNGGLGFDPLGGVDDKFNTPRSSFSGTFDGNGHTITGLTIARPNEDFTGLFGNTNRESVIMSVTLTRISVTGNENLGGVVGSHNGGTIKNVSVNGTVTGKTAENNSRAEQVGGIAGSSAEGSVIKDVSASVTVIGTRFIGGVVGNNGGQIRDASASRATQAFDVVPTNAEYVGGLVGSNSGSITTASASGAVNGTDRIGGLVGSNTGTVRNASATSSAEGFLQIGGLIGFNTGTIEKATASGDVAGNASAGGLVGVNSDGTIRNAAAFGAVTILEDGQSSNTDLAGGLVAENDGTIRDTFAAGAVISQEPPANVTIGGHVAKNFITGINGQTFGTIQDSYYDQETTGLQSSAGSATRFKTSQMTGEAARSNMSGLAYGEVWTIRTNDYPTLINDPKGPTAVNDTYTTPEDTTLTVSSPGVLRNDTDPDNDALTATVASSPTNGTLSLAVNGSFSYTPNADFAGTDSFTYNVSDETISDTGTVMITVTPVNDSPTAVDDRYTTSENESLTVAAPGVLDNDSDTDDNLLTATLVTRPSNGALSLATNGSFVYTPNPGFFGTDSFTYNATDGSLNSTATVTIDVSELNDPPTAVDDSYTTAENETLTVAAPGILSNDDDPNGDSLTATLLSNPDDGTVTFSANGSFAYTPDPGFTGTELFVYTITDGERGDTSTVTIDVTPVDDTAPVLRNASAVARDDRLTVVRDDDVVEVNVNVTDPGVSSTSSVTVDASGFGAGTVSLAETDVEDVYSGTFTVNASETQDSSEQLQITATDAAGNTNTVRTRFALTLDTQPPVASVTANQTAIQAGETIRFNASGSTDNNFRGPSEHRWDFDSDGIDEARQSFDTTDTVTYTFESAGTYTAELTVSDSAGNTNTTSLTIDVSRTNQAPTAVNDAYATVENSTLRITAPGVLDNDSDPNGDMLTATLVSSPTNGSLTFDADGSFNYTPAAGFTGTDSFTYNVTDGSLNSTATATIDVSELNDPPAAVDDSYTTPKDSTLRISAPGVLNNDSDPNGDVLNATIVSNPTDGSLTLNATGSFIYDPDADFTGTDSFTYSATDGTLTDTATVSINVTPVDDAAPVLTGASAVARDDRLTVVRDDDVVEVNLNMTDPGDGVIASVSVDASGFGAGTVSLSETNVEGVYSGTFTVNASNTRDSSEQLRITATDDAGNTNTTRTRSTLTLDTQPPVARVTANRTTIAPGEPIQFNVSGSTDDNFRGPDTHRWDFDSDEVIETRARFDRTDTVTYTFESAGTYTTELTVSDAAGNTNTTAITIEVAEQNQAPATTDETYSIQENTSLRVPAPGVLRNDSDPNGDALTAILVTNPANGELSFNTNGSFVYTPNSGFAGTDTFTYNVSDGEFNSTAKVSITVTTVNDALSARNDSYTVTESTDRDLSTLDISAPGVLGNDVDPDGDSLSARVVEAPTNGTLQLAANGSLSYTPEPGFTGPDTFRYEASDGSLSDTATVTIAVTRETDALVAVNDTYTTTEGQPLQITAPGVLENDSAPSGDTLTTTLLSGPTNGTLSLNANGSFTYTPDPGFTGTDAFVYNATDGSLNDTATAIITVTETTDAPTARDDRYNTTENTTLAVSSPGVLRNDTDPDNDTLAATVASNPTNGTLSLATNGSFVYTPNPGFFGADSFTYNVSDGTQTATATVTIRVLSTQPDDPAAPTVTNPTLTDLTDGNEVVTDGDRIEAAVTVTDTGGSGLASVTLDASGFGAQTVPLTDTNNDNVYNGTFLVDATQTGPDGTVTPQFNAIDDADNQDTTRGPFLTLDTTAPGVSVTANNTSIMAGETVRLSANAGDETSTVTSYTWQLGDGATATGPTVNHSYDRPGTYTAVVTVADSAGNTDTSSINITTTVPSSPSIKRGLAINGSTAYIADGTTIRVFDRQRPQISTTLPAPGPNVTGLAYGENTLWVTSSDGQSSTITALDPETGDINAQFLISFDPAGIAYHNESLWVGDQLTYSVRRFSTAGHELASFDVSNYTFTPAGIAYYNGRIWIGDENGPISQARLYAFTPGGTLEQITSERTAPYSGLAATDTALYGPDANGTLTVLRSQADPSEPRAALSATIADDIVYQNQTIVVNITARNTTLTNLTATVRAQTTTVSCPDSSTCTRQLQVQPSQSSWNGSAYEPVTVTVTATTEAGTTITTTQSVRIRILGDATGDGTVDIFDAVRLSKSWQATHGESDYVAAADFNGDGIVDISDAVFIGQNLGDQAATTAEVTTNSTLSTVGGPSDDILKIGESVTTSEQDVTYLVW